MKTLLFGIGLILLSLLCQTFSSFLTFPVPVSLIGMVLLFTFLIFLRRVPKGLSNVSKILLGNMSLFFIPITLSAVLLDNSLLNQAWIVVAALFVSTLLSLLITAWVARWLLSRLQHEH